MLSSATLKSRTVTKRRRFPRLPSLNTLKKVALACGLVSWILLGTVLKDQYSNLTRFLLGGLLSYGPMVFDVLFFKYRRRLELAGQTKKAFVLRLVASIVIIGGLKLQYEFLIAAVEVQGFTLTQSASISAFFTAISWIIMPVCWLKSEEGPPTAAA